MFVANADALVIIGREDHVMVLTDLTAVLATRRTTPAFVMHVVYASAHVVNG